MNRFFGPGNIEMSADEWYRYHAEHPHGSSQFWMDRSYILNDETDPTLEEKLEGKITERLIELQRKYGNKKYL